jgi:hypothetical protein
MGNTCSHCLSDTRGSDVYYDTRVSPKRKPKKVVTEEQDDLLYVEGKGKKEKTDLN